MVDEQNNPEKELRTSFFTMLLELLTKYLFRKIK